jgi:glycosyltransferase involved in cell wall biosynthesis
MRPEPTAVAEHAELAHATVLVLADWPALDAAAREWVVEVCVGSLGWGSRFGEEFAPVIVGADAGDDALPSGVAMYAIPTPDAEALLPATLRVVVAIGALSAPSLALSGVLARAGVPLVCRAGDPLCDGTAWTVTDAPAMIDTVYAVIAGTTPARATRGRARDATHATAPHAREARVDFEPPSVSIIIPSYNRVGYLRETIASCLAQEYADCRVIVTDDGSTDGTVDMVRDIDPRRVRLIANPHAGAPANRNRALATIDTPFVMWIGDDDVLVPSVVQSRIAMLQRVPDADVIHGDTAVCDAQLAPQHAITGEDFYHRPEALLAALFQRNVMADGGSLIRMNVFARAGWYDPAYPKGHDYQLWSRLALRAKFKYDPGVGALWRWHGANMGIGGGSNPYADTHRRIVLEMWARYDHRLLFPDVGWDTLPVAQHDAVGALLMAQRLVREEAWADAARFATLAVRLGVGDQAESFASTLRARAAAVVP